MRFLSLVVCVGYSQVPEKSRALQVPLQTSVASSETSSPRKYFYFCVLIDRYTPIRAQRHHVSVFVRTQEDVVGVEEVHVRRRASAANAAVALSYGNYAQTRASSEQLLLNLVAISVAGTLTLLAQKWLWRMRRGRGAAPADGRQDR